MDHHDASGAVAVRVGVFFSGTAMRRPAGVADAIGAIERLEADDFFQIAQLAFGPANLQPSPLPQRQFRRNRSPDTPAV